MYVYIYREREGARASPNRSRSPLGRRSGDRLPKGEPPNRWQTNKESASMRAYSLYVFIVLLWVLLSVIFVEYVSCVFVNLTLLCSPRGTKGVPRKGVWTSVNTRVWTCKEVRVKHEQTSYYLRPPFLRTPLAPSRCGAEDRRERARMAPAAAPVPAILYYTIPYHTIQYSTILYCTVLD